MTLVLSFRAESAAEARKLAEAWIAAEPNVESGKIVGVVLGPSGWHVTVDLTLLTDYEQQALAL